MNQIVLAIVLILISCSGCVTKNIAYSKDFDCGRFDEVRRNEYLKKYSKIIVGKSDSIFIEMADTNYLDYEMLFIGMDDDEGVIIISQPFWVVNSVNSIHRDRLINVERSKIKFLLDIIYNNINRSSSLATNSMVNDGACYDVAVNLNEKKTKIRFTAYSPVVFPRKQIPLSNTDLLVSTIYKFIESIEKENGRYIRMTKWLRIEQGKANSGVNVR